MNVGRVMLRDVKIVALSCCVVHFCLSVTTFVLHILVKGYYKYHIYHHVFLELQMYCLLFYLFVA